MEKYPGNWTTRQRPTQQHGKRCWAYGVAEAYSTTMGAYLKSYRQPAPTSAPVATPMTRPAGMAALQECFG